MLPCENFPFGGASNKARVVASDGEGAEGRKGVVRLAIWRLLWTGVAASSDPGLALTAPVALPADTLAYT